MLKLRSEAVQGPPVDRPRGVTARQVRCPAGGDPIHEPCPVAHPGLCAAPHRTGRLVPAPCVVRGDHGGHREHQQRHRQQRGQPHLGAHGRLGRRPYPDRGDLAPRKPVHHGRQLRRHRPQPDRLRRHRADHQRAVVLCWRHHREPPTSSSRSPAASAYGSSARPSPSSVSTRSRLSARTCPRSGTSTMASVTVTSAPGELVIDTVAVNLRQRHHSRSWPDRTLERRHSGRRHQCPRRRLARRRERRPSTCPGRSARPGRGRSVRCPSCPCRCRAGSSRT